jgi:hypothetical protein
MERRGPHRRQELYKIGGQNLVSKNYLENSNAVFKCLLKLVEIFF